MAKNRRHYAVILGLISRFVELNVAIFYGTFPGGVQPRTRARFQAKRSLQRALAVLRSYDDEVAGYKRHAHSSIHKYFSSFPSLAPVSQECRLLPLRPFFTFRPGECSIQIRIVTINCHGAAGFISRQCAA